MNHGPESKSFSQQSTIKTDMCHQDACSITQSLGLGRRKNVVIHFLWFLHSFQLSERAVWFGLVSHPFHEDSGSLYVNSNYQELVLRFQKGQEKVCLCSSSFLNFCLSGTVLLVCSTAGDKHHTMDCYTEGIAKSSVTKIMMGGVKISVFQVQRREGTIYML